nr:DUF6308 family protein [Arthrobacter jiangjiafuii]
MLKDYYTQPVSKGRVRTGARFDSWAGGGDAPDVVNAITADDMLAASFLSVPFEPAAVIGLLAERQLDITALLTEIPVDLDLADVTHDDFKAHLGEESPAWKLWNILRGKEDGGWGIGPTRASKLMARKRPRLIPIWDSVVGEEIGLKSSLTQWTDWHEMLTQDGKALATRLDNIRDQAEVPYPVSQLRVMDVVLWMNGTDGGAKAPSSEDEVA